MISCLNFRKQYFIEDFWSQFSSKSLTDSSADVKHPAFLVKTSFQMSSGSVWLIICDANWQTESYKQPGNLAQE